MLGVNISPPTLPKSMGARVAASVDAAGSTSSALPQGSGTSDLLLRLADRYVYAPLWSADLRAEWMRSLLADRSDNDTGVLDKTRAVMD